MSYEFYVPFFHVPGRYEWCTIHAEQYGSFDCFIVIHTTTDRPVTVYVSAESGARFMRERFPESTAVRVSPAALQIEAHDTRSARGRVTAEEGPVRSAEMEFVARADALPVATHYGDRSFAVWGSRFWCEGVDMELPAGVTGRVVGADGSEERFENADGILTVGSYGELQEL